MCVCVCARVRARYILILIAPEETWAKFSLREKKDSLKSNQDVSLFVR